MIKKYEAERAPVGRGEALTCHALVLKVDPTENGRFHVRRQRVPPFVFKSHNGFGSSRAVATIWGNHKDPAFSKKAVATLTSGSGRGQPSKGGGEHAAVLAELTRKQSDNVFNKRKCKHWLFIPILQLSYLLRPPPPNFYF